MAAKSRDLTKMLGADEETTTPAVVQPRVSDERPPLPKPGDAEVQMNIDVPPAVRAYVKRLALDEQLSLKELVVKALYEYDDRRRARR